MGVSRIIPTFGVIKKDENKLSRFNECWFIIRIVVGIYVLP